MADEKRFPPSARKLRKARESGDVAKSRELTRGLSALSGACYLIFFSKTWTTCGEILEKIYGSSRDFNSKTVLVFAQDAFQCLGQLLLPLLFVVLVTVVVVECWQVGFRISFED